jgi:hypothetical protein
MSASSSAELRSPWWTWIAVTSHPAATASATIALESAPPDSPHRTAVPAGGNVHRSSSSSTVSDRTTSSLGDD